MKKLYVCAGFSLFAFSTLFSQNLDKIELNSGWMLQDSEIVHEEALKGVADTDFGNFACKKQYNKADRRVCKILRKNIEKERYRRETYQ